MMLFDIQPAMDLTFSLKDVIYIAVLLISVVGGWFTLKFAISLLKQKIEALEEDILNAKNSRKGIKKQLVEGDKEVLKIVNGRIDIVKNDLKEQVQSNKQEFKEINKALVKVSADTGEIKGMLANFLNK